VNAVEWLAVVYVSLVAVVVLAVLSDRMGPPPA